MSHHTWCLGIRVCGNKISCPPRQQLNGGCIETVHLPRTATALMSIYYTMLTSLTRNALILSGGRGYRPGRRRRRYSTFAPSPDTCPFPVTNPRQGRRTRQLFSERGGCARGQRQPALHSRLRLLWLRPGNPHRASRGSIC